MNWNSLRRQKKIIYGYTRQMNSFDWHCVRIAFMKTTNAKRRSERSRRHIAFYMRRRGNAIATHQTA